MGRRIRGPYDKRSINTTKASKFVRSHKVIKRLTPGKKTTLRLRRPIEEQRVSVLRRDIDVPEWGVRVWLGNAE